MFTQTINVHVIIIVRVLPIKYLFSPARAVHFRIDQYYNRFIIRRSTILPLIVGRLTRRRLRIMRTPCSPKIYGMGNLSKKLSLISFQFIFFSIFKTPDQLTIFGY